MFGKDWKKMREKLRQLFIASRPLAWINTAYPFVLAYYLAGGSSVWIMAIGGMYFLIPYNALMYGINDVFDYESDIKNPRKGGVEGAKLKKKYHTFILWSVSLMNIPFVVYLSSVGTLTSTLALAWCVFMVVAYSAKGFRFKEKALLDSITSSSHFFGPALFALVLVGWQGSYLPYIIAFFCWGMASHAFGAVQDIIYDRKAGIGSIGTIVGAKWTVRFSLLLYSLSGAILATQGSYTLLVALCSLLYVASTAPYASISDEDSGNSNRGWKRFIWINWFTGFVITISVILQTL